MSKLQAALFCAATLAAAAGVSAMLFPYAALPGDVVRRASAASPMETFEDVDLGEDFGVVPVADLIGYYLENPPAAETAQPERRKHFGGC